jgi:two-component system sensor histidine kinase KdpD
MVGQPYYVNVDQNRPSPDALLAEIKSDDANGRRGRLKIFFGMCPGVGKTYTMLEAARQKALEGVDVVAGYVEPHARPDTEAILLGLEVLARKHVEYRGVTLEEFDLDAAMNRRPQLILVDELAHSNAPGSRHAKRIQDIEELLAAGIDVYTTLNVQHLESLNDVVAQITGVVVRETVPDRILDLAEDVELVDLPPDDLLERLREGRVYVPEQVGLASASFFRRENLTALRELALRVTADRVSAQVQVQHASRGIARPWATSERLLVCVGPSPLSARVIRSARRMAAAQHGQWMAVSVETPNLARKAALQVRRNLQLADRLGAETEELSGESVVDEILAFAAQHNISRIVIGKPSLPRWREWLRGSIIDELIRRSGEIDIHVVKGEAESQKLNVEDPKPALRKIAWFSYVKALAVVMGCTLVAWGLFPYFFPANLAMIFLVGVVYIALRMGTGPSVMASILAPLLFNFFFTQPYYSFAISDTQYLLTFFVLLGLSLLISGLSNRVRRQTQAARMRYMRTVALYFMSRHLATTAKVDAMASFAARHLADVFGCPAAILLPNSSGRLSVLASHGDMPLESVNEQAAADWVRQHRKWAGRGTDTLPACQGLYVPLTASDHAIGVIGLRLVDELALVDPDQQHLLETFASQISLALQRAHLAEEAQAARIDAESQRMRNALLSSVSHDLRTPLATIAGASSLLAEQSETLTSDVRRELAESIYEESDRLNRLVTNLLDITRLESGAVQLKREWQPLEEVIGAVLRRLEKKRASHPIQLQVPANLPLVPIDSLLIQQVFLNLLENAMKYSSDGSPISLAASASKEGVLVEVADRGSGLERDDCQRVFEKFYRSSQQQSTGGVGLGLTVCRGIVEAHGGRIWAENRPDGGASFKFTIPLTAPQPSPPPAEV